MLREIRGSHLVKEGRRSEAATNARPVLIILRNGKATLSSSVLLLSLLFKPREKERERERERERKQRIDSLYFLFSSYSLKR